ncbi:MULTISPECIES: TIGR01440 family protein [Bacillaceae]|uniref:TIGR01440 family protein n=1 Tax=Bacillaceae TaxID=186817 RepID=UPI0029640221|nr:TIGR01440 family protein [Bacillus infantis]MDW2876343.1 TIGR01440 family protein [Bacillus infantis]
MFEEIQTELREILDEFGGQVALNENSVLVVGCSTSEVIGKRIGTSGTDEAAAILFEELKNFAERTGARLAFQCCEHLNRALVVERQTADQKNLEEVSVVPVRQAGGAMASYAYRQFKDPAVVEFIKADAGIDIGDTLIGMHLKHVAVPIRTKQKSIGSAHVTLATTRPKLIGGRRAVYERLPENESC